MIKNNRVFESRNKGSIKKGNYTILKNIPVAYYLTVDPVSELSTWYGTFSINKQNNISPAGNPYKLILGDGRSGMIHITHLARNNSGKLVVNFRGSGLLE